MARVLSYSDFFLGSAGVAGALTGLLFVALSVTRGELTGEQASVEQQSIAATSFTALVDALWISLFALRPGNDIPTASLVLGLIGLTSTAGLTVRLWRARRREQLSNRWPFLLLVITALYGYQISTAFTAGSSLVAQSDAATLVFIFFGVGLARAWELLGLRGGGLLDLLATRGGGDRPPGGARAGPAEASRREPGAGP
jgi:hypothetical protein